MARAICRRCRPGSRAETAYRKVPPRGHDVGHGRQRLRRSRPVHGDLDVSWIHGSARRRYRTDPPLQAHAYDEHTSVLRQSKDVTYEAPFVVLLFGAERALLLDSGATADRILRETVDGLIASWLNRHPRHGSVMHVTERRSKTEYGRTGERRSSSDPA